MIRAFIVAAAVVAAPWCAVAAEQSGTITILEGDALVYRAASRLYGAEGVRLSPGDIIETAASTFAQIELADQSVAQLGPSTRLQVNAATTKQKSERWLYLMDGWVKLTGAKHDPAAGLGPVFDLRSQLVEIPAQPSVAVIRAAAGEVALF